MGWLKSDAVMRWGGKAFTPIYVNTVATAIALEIPQSGYSDYVVVENDLVFQVTSQETGTLTSSTGGDVNGLPYFTNNDWRLWYDGNLDKWILSDSSGPVLGETPLHTESWDSTQGAYVYDGDEYYTASTFNYACLVGTAGTFTKNTDSSTITLTASWPSNIHVRLSGTSGQIVGEYGTNQHKYWIGFESWKTTQDGDDYYIYDLNDANRYIHLFPFNRNTLNGKTLSASLQGIYHDAFGIPNIDTDKGFYFHAGTAYPRVNQSYTLKWCHYVPDEGQAYDGHIEYATEYGGISHPDITFTYNGLVEKADNDIYNHGYIYMADASVWR